MLLLRSDHSANCRKCGMTHQFRNPLPGLAHSQADYVWTHIPGGLTWPVQVFTHKYGGLIDKWSAISDF